MMMIYSLRTSTRIISLKEVGDRFPVAANAHHHVAVDGSYEVRLFPLQLVSKLNHHHAYDVSQTQSDRTE